MSQKKVSLTLHARQQIEERNLHLKWIETAALDPEWRELDPERNGVEKRFRTIPDHGDRVLRVVAVETSAEIRILTAFFDRKARRP